MRFPRFTLRCLLMGHDDLIRRECDRIYLECSDCGRATRGWTLGRSKNRASPRTAGMKCRLHEFAAAA